MQFVHLIALHFIIYWECVPSDGKLPKIETPNFRARKLLQQKDCKITTGIKKCPDYRTGKTSRLNPLEVYASHSSTCRFKTVSVVWNLTGSDSQISFPGQNPLRLKPYYFTKAGPYSFIFQITGTTKDGERVVEYDQCHIEIRPEVPIPIIIGGQDLIIPSGESFILDGSKSIDVDVPPGQSPKLNYKWTCRLIQGDKSNSICSENMGTGSTFTVPQKYVLDGYRYEFTLAVNTESLKKWQSVGQKVRFTEGASRVEIVCMKNCPPAALNTLSTQITVLKAVCTKHCNNFKENSFVWSIWKEKIDCDKNTQFGCNVNRFVINSNVLEPEKTYKVVLNVKDGLVGGTTRVLKPKKPPEIKSCKVQPPNGVALKTMFRVDCQFSTTPKKLVVYTSKKNKEVPVSSGIIQQQLLFGLPANADVFIKMIDGNGAEAVHKLEVTVKPVISQPGHEKQVRAIISTLLKVTRDMMRQQRFDMAVQYINGILEELNLDTFFVRKVRQEVRREILNYLIKMPITTYEQVQQVAALATTIRVQNFKPFHPVVDEEVSSLCRKAASVQLDLMKMEPYPKSKSVGDATKLLLNCVEIKSKQDLTNLSPDTDALRPTTPFPILTDVEVITEDYPDYVDNTVSSHGNTFRTISTNVVEICNSSTRMIALTMAEGEKPYLTSSTACSALVIRMIGRDLAKEVIKAEKLAIVPPRYFTTLSHSIDTMVCSWQSDVFWWNSAGTEASTAILLLNFIRTDTREDLNTFRSPLELTFDSFATVSNKKTHKVRFPPSNFVPKDDFSVVRIDVLAEQNFYVEFLELMYFDIFEVVITCFKRPRASDFDNGQRVTNNNSVIYQKNDRKHSAWWYVGIRGVEQLKERIYYTLLVYSVSCYLWDNFNEKWKFACSGSIDRQWKSITCKCHHLSILSGFIRHLTVHTQDMLLQPDFTMTLVQSYTIFVCTTLTLFLYCILLLITAKNNRKSGRAVYLLADASRYACYVYLIIVRTGKRFYSGTTANVCIQINGIKSHTKPHVLNYPDPQQRILQRGNEDWFVLTAKRYLGPATMISLWSDCLGRSPSWLCEDVTIYDVQTKERWYFPVNHWFNLMADNGQCYIEVRSSEIKEVPDKKYIQMLKLASFVPRLGLSVTSFFKVNVVLSTILSIYLANLVLCGLPKLRLSDGFTTVRSSDYYTHAIWMGMCSCVAASGIHLVSLWIYEKKNQFRKYCWTFLIFNIPVSVCFLLIFGFWIPPMLAWLWLISSAISILIYILIIIRLEGIVFKVWLQVNKCSVTVADELEELVLAVEPHRNYLFKRFGEALLRPYLGHLYKPLDEGEIKLRKSRVEFRMEVAEIVMDTIMFSIYMMLLCLVILADRSNLTIKSHREMSNLISGTSTRTHSFDVISGYSDIYYYLNDTLIPAMQRAQWYFKFVVRAPGMMANFQDKYVGVTRLRQHRVAKHSCRVPSKLLKIAPDYSCESEYWVKPNYDYFGNEDTKDDRLSQVWNYSKDAGTVAEFGKIATYPGGGYIAPLGRTIYNSYVNLHYLVLENWLDSATRAVFVEFLAYNPNCNLFNAIKILVERSATGYIKITWHVETSKLLFVREETGKMALSIFCAFFAIVVIFSVKLVGRLWRKKSVLFKDWWLFVDLVIIGMTLGCLILYIQRMKIVKKFLDRVRTARNNEFIQYFHMFYLEKTLTWIAGFLICVATIRLWKLVRFGLVFKIMEKTIVLSAKPILAIAFCHLIFTFNFSLFAYTVFSDFVNDFRDLPNTIMTLTLLSLGMHESFDFTILKYRHQVLGYIFYSTFMIATIVIFTVYIAIIVMCYEEAQLFYSTLGQQNQVLDYLTNELWYCKTWCRAKIYRLKGGKNPTYSAVQPKAEEHRYANCICLSSNRMNLMECVAKSTYKYNLNEEEKLELMSEIAWCSIRKDDANAKEIFLIGRVSTNRKKLIHDSRIVKMETIVKKLMDRKELEKRMRRKELTQLRYTKLIEKQLRQVDYVLESLNSVVNIVSGIEIK